MTEQTIWTVLGIPEGSDRSEVRRAYARKVRAVNPEDDPEGFKVLREAFEIALYYADLPPSIEGEPGNAPASAWSVVEAPADAAPFESASSPPPIDDEEALLDALLNRFGDLLDDERADRSGELESVLEQVVASPALTGIGAQQRAERWIAFHIARTIPRSDFLIDRAVAAFGWDDGEIVRDAAVGAILQRIDEWRFIHWAADLQSPVHSGWLALTRPPKARWEVRMSALSAARSNQVEQILRTAGNDLPGLYDQLDAGAAEWWHQHLGKARATIGVLALAPFLAALVALSAALIDRRAWPALVPLGGIFALASPWLYLRFVKQPQLEWQRWTHPAPSAWFSEGYMTALLLLPIAAAPLPPGVAGGAVALLLSALVAAWTAAAAPSPYPLADLGTRLPLMARRLAFPLFGGISLLAGLQDDYLLQFLCVGGAVTFAWWRASEEMGYALARYGGRWRSWAAAAAAVALAGGIMTTRDVLEPEASAYLAALAVALMVPILVLAWRTDEEKRFAVVLGLVALAFMRIGTQQAPPPGSLPAAPSSQIPGEAAPATGGYVSPYCTAGTPNPDSCIWPTPEEKAEEEKLLAEAPTSLSAQLRLEELAQAAASEAAALRSGRGFPRPVQSLGPPFTPSGTMPADATRPSPSPTAVQAPPPARCPRGSAAAGPRAPVACEEAGSWFVASDYPEAALQRQISGTTRARLEIGVDGRVKSCRIGRSSGSAALDTATCDILRRRGRFLPARNAAGEKVAGTSLFAMSWTLRR